MRNRLTVSFIVLSILLLVGAGVVRAFVLRDLIREQESAHLQQQAALVGQIVTTRQGHGGSVDRSFLEGLVASDGRLAFAPQDGPPVVVLGKHYHGTDGVGDLAASASVAAGTVTV